MARAAVRGDAGDEIPFIWYWHHDVVLEKPGYERHEALEQFRTPPWFVFPLDLFAELAPFPISDTRERHYVLTPKEPSLEVLEPEPRVIQLPETISP